MPSTSLVKPLFGRKQQKCLKKFGRFRNKAYLCNDKSRPLPIRTAYPAGHFLYIGMRYTKQAMTLAQQIQTLQSRGLERVEFSHSPEPEPEVIFEYKDIRDLWKNLRIHDLTLKEVIERSVVMVMH